MKRLDKAVRAGGFDASHPPALAVYCSDGRFTDAVEQLLRHLGHGRLDTLTFPGGPALLNGASAMPSDVHAVSRGASFLIKAHSIRHVLLLAHEGCGYYRERYPSRGAPEIRKLQEDDLRASARWVSQTHGNVDVQLVYVGVSDGHVVFTPLE